MSKSVLCDKHSKVPIQAYVVSIDDPEIAPKTTHPWANIQVDSYMHTYSRNYELSFSQQIGQV